MALTCSNKIWPFKFAFKGYVTGNIYSITHFSTRNIPSMKTRMKHPGNIFGAFQEMERSWKHFPVTVRQVLAFLIKLFKKKSGLVNIKQKKQQKLKNTLGNVEN
jgi:hypothetical protein